MPISRSTIHARTRYRSKVMCASIVTPNSTWPTTAFTILRRKRSGAPKRGRNTIPIFWRAKRSTRFPRMVTAFTMARSQPTILRSLIFWWPYLYQSLDDAFSFSISPAYLSSWGPSLLSQVTFPIGEKIKGRVRLDYRVRRGVALCFESDIDYGKDDSSWAKLKTYYIQDQNPLINRTSLPRGSVPTGRYRVSLEDRTNFTKDIYGIVDITKLSDAFIMQDFYQSEFRIDPVPDAVVALTKTDPFYTLTGIVRFEANSFFEQTKRLPEVVLDVKRHALFGTPIFYEGETGVADLRRNFASKSDFENYSTVRDR